MWLRCSAHAYYIPAQAWRGSESSNTSHFHIGTPVYVGEDNEVRPIRALVGQDADFERLVSWRILKSSLLYRVLKTQSNDL